MNIKFSIFFILYIKNVYSLRYKHNFEQTKHTWRKKSRNQVFQQRNNIEACFVTFTFLVYNFRNMYI